MKFGGMCSAAEAAERIGPPPSCVLPMPIKPRSRARPEAMAQRLRGSIRLKPTDERAAFELQFPIA
jgi:hypothetical protein